MTARFIDRVELHVPGVDRAPAVLVVEDDRGKRLEVEVPGRFARLIRCWAAARDADREAGRPSIGWCRPEATAKWIAANTEHDYVVDRDTVVVYTSRLVRRLRAAFDDAGWEVGVETLIERRTGLGTRLAADARVVNWESRTQRPPSAP